MTRRVPVWPVLGSLLAIGFVTPSRAQNDAPPPPAEAAVSSPLPETSAHGEVPAPAGAVDATDDSAHGHGHNHTPPGATTAAETVVAPGQASLGYVFGLDFMRRALAAGLIVAAVCGYLGVFVVLRRIVFVGAALAELSSAGIALGLYANIPPMVGAVGTMLAGVGLLSVPWSPRKVRQDAFIGVGYAAAAALVVLLLAKYPGGDDHLHDLLFGDILVITAGEVWSTLWALGAVALVHLLLAKEMLFVSFDPDTARASGYRVWLWEALLYVTVGVAIAFAIHAVGVLLTFASLVFPAVTALLATRRLRSALAASVALGVVTVPLGLYVSFVRDLPSAATVAGIGFAFLLVGGLVSRLRPT